MRYDGNAKSLQSQLINNWHSQGRFVKICPEISGGLPVPRPPAEQVNERVVTDQGQDVSAAFKSGAHKALELCQTHNVRFALLKARSPSCGNIEVYDGTFTKKVVPGSGVTAKLLIENGIQVFNEEQIADLALTIKNQS